MSAPAAVRGGTRPALTLVAALLGLFITLLDLTVVNVALPVIRTDLHTDLSGLEWIANAYLLALATLIVTAGRVGDRTGHRRVYIGGVSVFLLGSAMCAAAGKFDLLGLASITELHIGRVVQGVGAAVIVPLSLAIIYTSFEGKMRRLGIVLWGAIGGLATAIGPLVGGILVDHVGWQAIFLINLPIGVVVIAAALGGVSNTRGAPLTVQALDLPGLVSLGVALGALSLALIDANSWGWTSVRLVVTLTVSAVAFIAFVAAEGRAAEPIVEFEWFRRPPFGAAVALSLLLGASVFALVFYVSIYLQTGLGLSPEATGLRLLPLTAMVMVGAPVGGRLLAVLGTRRLLVFGYGILAVGAALFALAAVDAGDGGWQRILPAMLVSGFALGMIMPVVSELVISAGPPDQVGMAASLGAMFRQVGNALGIAIMGALLSSQLRDTSPRQSTTAVGTALHHMAWYAAAVSAAAAIVALLGVFQPSRAAHAAARSPRHDGARLAGHVLTQRAEVGQ